jgi:hypothetical protein
MGMMINILNKKIKEMKDLRQREERRDNKAAQDALDLKFKLLTEQIHQMMTALQYAKENMQFQLSETVLTDLENLLIANKGAIRSGFTEKDSVSKVETDLKSIQLSIKKEWSKQYAVLTNSTISTLKVISGIDSEHVTKCLEGIAKGETWTTSIGDFKTMNNRLSDANTLIAGLGLDQPIIDFLQKMNSGKATIADLDEKVLNWLKTEALDKRVRLSFSSAVKKY